MDNLPEIPFFWIDTVIVGFAVVALLAIHLGRVLLSEVRPRKCVFCDKSIPAGDYEHHLEVCGLTKGCARQAPAEPKVTAVSAGGTRRRHRHGGDGVRRSPVVRRAGKIGEDRILYMRYHLISEASHLLLLVPGPNPAALTVKKLDGTAVLCEAPDCGRPAFYLLSAGKPAVLHAAYCGVRASLFTGGMNVTAHGRDFPSRKESGARRTVKPGVTLYLEDRESAVIASLVEAGVDIRAGGNPVLLMTAPSRRKTV